MTAAGASNAAAFGVELVGVSKKYGARFAVRDVSLQVQEGEFLSVVGPSGCGKTTLLRLIAGFTVPDSGEVRIGGQPMNDVPVRERRVGIVFQNYALFPNMNIFENVAFGMRVQKKPEEFIKKRVTELLKMTEMGDRADAWPRQLSGGQQQRVALARALAIEPRVLLLDEPLSALDAKVRNSLRFEIRRIQRESNITMVYVTHDQEEALSVSDRVGLMRGGALEQLGTPFELYGTPRSLFAADFIGVNNIFHGHCDGAGHFTWSGGTFSVAGDYPAGPSLMMVRPERLCPLDNEPVQGETNLIEGTILGRVFLGPISRIAFSSGGVTLLMDVLNTSGFALKGGDHLKAQFSPEEAHVLPDTDNNS
ncbi:MAG: ABC transporter ATP-binding protein [Synergistaceae bacterium]|jgi:ABC-type Fe3+/spermidine/putrescine transport system ATPase subunit|nr:ABC transporter ATP-binding protein [Synergistaceae bacterium]